MRLSHALAWPSPLLRRKPVKLFVNFPSNCSSSFYYSAGKGGVRVVMVIVAPESWDYQAAASKTMLESLSCVVLPDVLRVRLVSLRLDHPLFAALEY